MATAHAPDLDLPAWGPYSRHTAAIVHIPDVATGRTAELTPVVGIYRGALTVPSQRCDSAWAPTAASADLAHWAHRLELPGAVTCAVAVDRIDGEADRQIALTIANDGSEPAAVAVHLLAACRYPRSPTASTPLVDAPLRPWRLVLPPGGAWTDARDHRVRSAGTPTARDTLSYDGWVRGEVRRDRLIDAAGMLLNEGDRLVFAPPAGQRWLRWQGGGVRLAVAGVLTDLPAAPDGAWRDLGVGSGELVVRVVSGSVVLEGLATADACPEVVPWSPTPAPERLPCAVPDALLLRWPDLPGVYGLVLDRPWSQLRTILSERLDEILRAKAQDHVADTITGDGGGHWTDVIVQPLTVPAGGTLTMRCRMVHADDAAACARLLAAPRWRDPGSGWDAPTTPSGAAHRASQQALAATVFQNVAYPVYTRRRHIRHHTPGKTWDSLYTWDSGFIALALCDLDVQRATDCLATYVTGPDDRDCAFIHHGTPLPVQIHAAHLLFNRTQDRDLIRRLWPGLVAMHRFLAGRDPQSLTGRLGSGLLQTWAYFYNSGGWDDYPPQWHLYVNGGHDRIAPAVTSAHVARSALILAQFARLLGEDTGEFIADHRHLVGALDTHAWNETDGIYSYVVHDAAGQPTGPMRHASGADFNLGLDGVSPLVARAGDAARRRRLIERLRDPSHLWSPIGITTVDQQAPYFSKKGYWNGTVWFPHQWFLWRAALDLGAADLAWDIARTAMDLWSREVTASGRCYEHFPLATGRGAGWHHFGGLSSPLVNWHAAYHRPGRITTGADALVTAQRWTGTAGVSADLVLAGEPGAVATVIVCCDPSPARQVRFAGGVPVWRERIPGAVEVDLPADATGTLAVS